MRVVKLESGAGGGRCPLWCRCGVDGVPPKDGCRKEEASRRRVARYEGLASLDWMKRVSQKVEGGLTRFERMTTT